MMNINFRYLLISFLVGLMVFIVLLWKTDLFKTIKIEFDSLSNKSFYYSVFWKEKESDTFTATKKMTQKVSHGNNHVKFFLPTKNIFQFRIDFGAYPGAIKISNLKINDNKVILTTLSPNHHIKDFNVSNDELNFLSNDNDPFIVSGKVNYTFKKHITLNHILYLCFGIYVL